MGSCCKCKCGCGCKDAAPVGPFFRLYEATWSLPTVHTPPVITGAPVNMMFALDSSRSSVLGQDEFSTHPFDHTDRNGDGQVGSHFDAMLGTVEAALAAINASAFDPSDVRLSVVAFEGDQPVQELTYQSATIFGTDLPLSAALAGYTTTAKFGRPLPLQENGNAYFAPVVEKANSFFTSEDRAGVTNLVYVLTESAGSDTTGAGTPFTLALQAALALDPMPTYDVVGFDAAVSLGSVASTVEYAAAGPSDPSLGDKVFTSVLNQTEKDAFVASVTATLTAL